MILCSVGSCGCARRENSALATRTIASRKSSNDMMPRGNSADAASRLEEEDGEDDEEEDEGSDKAADESSDLDEEKRKISASA